MAVPLSLRLLQREIEMIKTYFDQNNETRKVFVLLGLGGAGKTQTALKYAHLMAPRLEGLLFIDGSSRQNIETALSAFAASKHIGNAYMDALIWLGSRNAHWLIVFDNVDDPAVQVHEYFPLGGKYNVLITTRRSEVSRLAQNNSARCSISELAPEDGYRLLLKEAGLSLNGLQESERSAATALLQKLGYLALAISHSGAYICRNKCSIAEYRDMFVAEPQAMLGVNETAAGNVQGCERSVHLTWEISYRQVGATSKRILGLATFLHRDRISQDIFRRAYQNSEQYQPAVPPTDAEADAQREVKDILQLFVDKKRNWSNRLFVEAMGELVCLSLMTFDTINHIYQLHPLVQEWTRALASETSVAIERTAFLLALSIDEGSHSEDHAFRRAVVPHVNEIMTLCPTPNSNNAWQFIKSYDEAGQVDKCEPLELQVLEARVATLGREDPATLAAMRYVAGTHVHRGRLKQAEELYSTVIAAQQRVLGGDHPDTLASTAALAVAYLGLGCFAEAEALDKQVLTARKRVLGDDHPDTLRSMSNLAATYLSQGRYAEAEPLQLETLAARKRVLGESHPDTLRSMGTLGTTYHSQGRLAEAEMLEVETLAGRKRVLGESHRHTVIAMRNLALTYKAQGRQAEHEELMARVDSISANR